MYTWLRQHIKSICNFIFKGFFCFSFIAFIVYLLFPLLRPAVYETRKIYSNMITNIECHTYKYSFSTHKKSWHAGIKDGRSHSPTDQFKNIGMCMYRRLARKEKKLYYTKRNAEMGRAVLICKNGLLQLKNATPASWYFIHAFSLF